MSVLKNPRAFPSGAIDPKFGGMTLRDWFAGQALAGLLAGQYSDSGNANLSEVPKEAYLIADAMLKERGQ